LGIRGVVYPSGFTVDNEALFSNVSRDLRGNLVPGRVYFYCIEADKYRATGKAIKR